MTVQIRQLDTAAADFEAEFAQLRHWSEEADHAIEERVAAILADVKRARRRRRAGVHQPLRRHGAASVAASS